MRNWILLESRRDTRRWKMWKALWAAHALKRSFHDESKLDLERKSSRVTWCKQNQMLHMLSVSLQYSKNFWTEKDVKWMSKHFLACVNNTKKSLENWFGISIHKLWVVIHCEHEYVLRLNFNEKPWKFKINSVRPQHKRFFRYLTRPHYACMLHHFHSKPSFVNWESFVPVCDLLKFHQKCKIQLSL